MTKKIHNKVYNISELNSNSFLALPLSCHKNCFKLSLICIFLLLSILLAIPSPFHSRTLNININTMPVKRQRIIPKNLRTPHNFNFVYNVVLQISKITNILCYNSATFSTSRRVVAVGLDGVPETQFLPSIEFFHCNLIHTYISILSTLINHDSFQIFGNFFSASA